MLKGHLGIKPSHNRDDSFDCALNDTILATHGAYDMSSGVVQYRGVATPRVRSVVRTKAPQQARSTALNQYIASHIAPISYYHSILFRLQQSLQNLF